MLFFKNEVFARGGYIYINEEEKKRAETNKNKYCRTNLYFVSASFEVPYFWDQKIK